MKTGANLIVFGDLATSFEEDLRHLLHIGEDEVLQSFLNKAAYALRRDLTKQPAAIQGLFPRFTSIIDILSKLGETEGSPVLRFFLITVCQLSQFIHYYHNRDFPSVGNTAVLGVCAGSFAASAVTSSKSISDLVNVGVGASRAAFNTALTSFLRRNDISRTEHKSWSALVSRKKPIEDLLHEFQIEKTVSPSSALYISARSATNFTLSGSPDVLEEFVSSRGLDCHWMPIETPFHAPHLFTQADVESAMPQSIDSDITSRRIQRRLLSGSDGSEIGGETFGDLLRKAIQDVLTEQVNWELIISSFSNTLKTHQQAKCDIVPFHCGAVSMLSTALSKQDNISTSVHDTRPVTASNRGAEASGRFDHSKIAIVGYSGRFPESDSPSEFWDLLREGRDVHKEIPEDRFDWKAHYDATGKAKNTSRVKYGCFIKQPGMFDARFFNMSPREADNTDPAQRLAITSTYEAIEMAGLVPNRTPSTQQDRIGVFFGTTSDDWREVNSGQNVDTYFIPGGNRAFVPGRISYFFRFSGPSLSIDTACSSSFAAIQTACSYLWRGECDTAVAGGTNVLTNPDNFAGLDRGHFLSTTGNCNAFDDEASGYCRADAVGSVILKRLDDAIADNDPIHAVITGSNTNHCGQTESITRPHEGDQASVFKRVLRYHNVDPHEISYIEMHGTGTQAGDATEMRSVLSVFLPKEKRQTHQPLYLGSAKANIGHSESASGVTSLIKVMMMMKNSEIPPHCGIKGKINRNYPKDLKEKNVRIALEPTSWLREDSTNRTRRVFLNNFSAAGGNTAILLEDAPERQISDSTPANRSYPITVTAKSAKSLLANLHNLAQFLDSNPSTSLLDLSYTTAARRIHHSYRVVCQGDSVSSLLEDVKRQASTLEPKAIPTAAKLPKVAFAFTGQGSLYLAMGKELYESNSLFAADIDRFDALAQQQGFSSFLSLVDGTAANIEDASVVSIHLALVSLQMALTNLWASWGIAPSVVIGHSLGEYAALFAAQVITASEAVYLVGTRARLIEKLCTPGTHKMVAVKSALDSIQSIVRSSGCEVACCNQPSGTVLSGQKDAVAQLSSNLKSDGHECVDLDIPFAFHSAQVDPILDEFRAACRSVNYRCPIAAVLSPLTAGIKDDNNAIDANYLPDACRGTVNFQGALQAAEKAGVINQSTTWIEVGVHTICSGMIKGTMGASSRVLASLRKGTNPWTTMTSSLTTLYMAGYDVDWNSFHTADSVVKNVVALPRYNWDLKNHWIMYKNNFCLAKGADSPVQALPQATATEVAVEYPYISPGAQKLLQAEYGTEKSSLLVESDAFHRDMFDAIGGHIVNGARLCPSSLYGEIALSLAHHLIDNTDGVSFKGLDVCDVKVNNPLIALPSETSHLFRIKANASWTKSVIDFSIYSVDANGKTTASHANLKVQLTKDQSAWIREWNSKAYLINGRIAALKQDAVNGSTHRLRQKMVYKLFASIVTYNPDYQGMDEVLLDTEALEATAKVTFKVNKQGYKQSPFWIDSLGQIAGFIMNGNENLQSDKQVFINHGWGHMRFIEELDFNKQYTTYNKMQLIEGTLYSGDTYILDGDRIVALYEGVTFQGVPRKLLDNLLPSAQGKPKAAAQPAKPASAPKPAKATPKAAPVASTPKPSAVASSIGFNEVLRIISEEAGVPIAELLPESEFASFGIDSLLSLTVTSRIAEEVGMELPSSLFNEFPTVKELEAEIRSKTQSEESTSLPTPELLSEIGDDDSSSFELLDIDEQDSVDVGVVMNQIISEETGIASDSLLASSCLGDLGVDSLLSLTIADALSEALGTDIASTLLTDNETLADIEAALRKIINPNAAVPTKMPTSKAVTAAWTESVAADPIVQNAPHATSVLLQAPKVNPTKAKLFLFPDGSGSASSYAGIDKLDPSVAVYGLNCPWRTTADDMAKANVQMSQLVAKFVMEIRKLQPSGPYYLGGWSAGGICAFEAVRQLQEAGETVNKLVLIDSPNPIGLENPPARMYDFFQSLGIFGGPGNKDVPAWLRKHFDAFIKLLDAYEPSTLKNAPSTIILYAKDGVCKNTAKPELRDDDPREMKWLINDRTDFKAEGWSELVGRQNLNVEVLNDVNHFTMMDKGVVMTEMSRHIRQFLMS